MNAMLTAALVLCFVSANAFGALIFFAGWYEVAKADKPRWHGVFVCWGYGLILIWVGLSIGIYQEWFK